MDSLSFCKNFMKLTIAQLTENAISLFLNCSFPVEFDEIFILMN